MYFTSVVLLNSPYFYKETRNLFNIPLSDVSGLSVMCSGKVWKIIVLITLRCNISHFSAHLTFPYFLSGGPGKHQMPKAELHLLILSEVTKKVLPELLQNSNFTIWLLGEKTHPFNILLYFQHDFMLPDNFRFLIALKALIYWANMRSTDQRSI